jgi:nitronate monooxygenase
LVEIRCARADKTLASGHSEGYLVAFKTRVTEMLGIENPIVQGGMQGVGYAEVASAVSNAGGLGLITATQPTPQALRDEIARCRQMTDKPFGVNITVLPAIQPPDYKGFAEAAIHAGITIFETAHRRSSRDMGKGQGRQRQDHPQMHRRAPRRVG